MKKHFIIYAPAINSKSAGAHSILESFLNSLGDQTTVDSWQFVGHKDYHSLCAQHSVKFHELDLNLQWLKRIAFDFYLFKKTFLTKATPPSIILSMQNTTPVMRPQDQNLTYLHQAIPFLEEFHPPLLTQPKLFFIKHFYYFFINFGIKKNRSFFIVQSEWLKKIIAKRMDLPLEHIFIHRPMPTDISLSDYGQNKNDSFFYPAIYQIYKNHLNLIKGFCLAAAANSSSEYCLELTLDNIRFKKLMTQVGNIPKNLHVKNCGVLTRQATLQKIINAKAIIFPSLLESYGMPIAEALFFKTPVIASNLPYAQELLSNNGIFFDPYDTESIKKSILNFRSEPECMGLSTEKFQSWSDILNAFSNSIKVP